MWPFSKGEDWRDSEEEEWRTVSAAGEYVYQLNCVKQVRFPDGLVRWNPRRYQFGYLYRTIPRSQA